MVQRVKDPTFSRPWLGSSLRRGLDPWPGSFHVLQGWAPKEYLLQKNLQNRNRLKDFKTKLRLPEGKRVGEGE